eukprot:4917890-Alexandrium_andersonii.AAC.1
MAQRPPTLRCGRIWGGRSDHDPLRGSERRGGCPGGDVSSSPADAPWRGLCGLLSSRGTGPWTRAGGGQR